MNGQSSHHEHLHLLSNVYPHNLQVGKSPQLDITLFSPSQPTPQDCAGSHCQGEGAALRLQEQQSCLQPRAAAGTGWEQSVECADGTASNRFLTG